MKRVSVKSTNIISVGYDEKEKLLEVEFVNSGVYKYYNVPKEIYEQALNAPSIGKFIWTSIRGRYRFSK